MHIVSYLVAATFLLPLSPAARSCSCDTIPQPLLTCSPLPDRVKGVDFTHTDQYKQEFDKAVTAAQKACLRHLGEDNIAIVSDIDETLLDNRPEISKHPSSDQKAFHQWIEQACAKPLKPTADFLAWARQNKFAIFLVTGRCESERRPTIENLLKAGIAYDGLYMRPDGDHRPAEQMKTAYRKQIECLGFKIIANIGDQYSDLYGGHAEDCEKLPNRMYYIP